MPSFDFPEIPNTGGIFENKYTTKDGINQFMGEGVVVQHDKGMEHATLSDRNVASPTQEVHTIKIIVPGEPVPKGRPRARIVKPRGKPEFIHFYQDAETQKYEERVAQEAFLVMRGRGLLLGALRIEVRAYLPIPNSWSKKKTEAASDNGMLEASVLPTGRPDADNFLKIIDARNSVVWKDDSQIVDMKVSKRYSEKPRLEIEIFPA